MDHLPFIYLTFKVVIIFKILTLTLIFINTLSRIYLLNYLSWFLKYKYYCFIIIYIEIKNSFIAIDYYEPTIVINLRNFSIFFFFIFINKSLKRNYLV